MAQYHPNAPDNDFCDEDEKAGQYCHNISTYFKRNEKQSQLKRISDKPKPHFSKKNKELFILNRLCPDLIINIFSNFIDGMTANQLFKITNVIKKLIEKELQRSKTEFKEL